MQLERLFQLQIVEIISNFQQILNASILELSRIRFINLEIIFFNSSNYNCLASKFKFENLNGQEYENFVIREKPEHENL